MPRTPIIKEFSKGEIYFKVVETNNSEFKVNNTFTLDQLIEFDKQDEIKLR